MKKSILIYFCLLFLLMVILLHPKYEYYFGFYMDVGVTMDMIEGYSKDLEVYKEIVGRYPTNEEGLMALIKKYQKIDSRKWRLPRVWRRNKPIDKWGNQIIYQYNNNNKVPKMYSRGVDGISSSGGNDIDDINSWDRRKKWRKYYHKKRKEKKQVVIIFNWLLIIIIIFINYKLLKLISNTQNKTEGTEKFICPLLVIIGFGSLIFYTLPNYIGYTSSFYNLSSDALPLVAFSTILVWSGYIGINTTYVIQKIPIAIIPAITTYYLIKNIVGIF